MSTMGNMKLPETPIGHNLKFIIDSKYTEQIDNVHTNTAALLCCLLGFMVHHYRDIEIIDKLISCSSFYWPLSKKLPCWWLPSDMLVDLFFAEDE